MSSSSSKKGASSTGGGGDGTTVSYSTYSKIFDECAADKFRSYASRFTCIYFALSISQILLSAVAALFQTTTITSDLGDDVEQALNTASIGLGFSAAFVGSVLHITKVHVAAYECNLAYANLSLYLSSKKAMPIHLYESVMKTHTFCHPVPRRCGEETV